MNTAEHMTLAKPGCVVLERVTRGRYVGRIELERFRALDGRLRGGRPGREREDDCECQGLRHAHRASLPTVRPAVRLYCPAMSVPAAETHASILSLPDLVNHDAGLVRRGRHLTATFLVEAGDAEFLVRVVEGRVAAVERGPFLMRSWTFALRASAETWQRFWEPIPAPGLPRPLRDEEARGGPDRGRPRAAHGPSALRQGRGGRAPAEALNDRADLRADQGDATCA